MSRRNLVRQLETARRKFCGLGTRKVKVRLNKLAETCAIAKALRIALEIEDTSTLGKNTPARRGQSKATNANSSTFTN